MDFSLPPAAWLGLQALLLVFALAMGLRGFALARAPRLQDHPAPPPASWPRLSVVIAAKDEGATLRAAVSSLLDQRYPDLEVVLVNDRSDDDTGSIMDELASGDGRVRVVHVRELPEGWLGKVHAQHLGLKHATGSWLLLADADTEYREGALEAGLALALHLELDHLSLLPHLQTRGLMQAALIANFHDTYVERLRGRSDPIAPKRGPAFGFGAFNLVRREAFEATAGLAWLKLDIADDLALGQMMREHGRSAFLLAPEALHLDFYPSARAALAGWEKNAFGILARFSLLRAFALAAAVSSLAWLLPVAIALPWLPRAPLPAAVVGALALATFVLAALVGQLRLGRSAVGALAAPLAWLAMAFALVRAGLVCRRRGGILWRGQLYPEAALKAGQRARFP